MKETTTRIAVAALILATTMAVAEPLPQAATKSGAASQAATQPATRPAETVSAVEQMRSEAEALRPLVKTDFAKAFLAKTAELPSIETRMIYRDPTTKLYISRAYRNAHLSEMPSDPSEVVIDEGRYYFTKYGTPLAYARPLDLLGQSGMKDVKGKKILDFGYGTVGHLRLLALCGAKTTGVDVDSFLTAVYSESVDQGVIKAKDGTTGTITLVNGQYPADAAAKQAVGGGYDLIISKNTLKRGYIHPPPEENVDPRKLVHLGADDETFAKTLYDALNPGGRLMIYNICPAPAPPGKDYIPWADGRCPFEQSLLEKVGFKVLAFDADDSPAARAQGHALKWDVGEGAMNLENDLFAHYTLLEKPAK